ncbi:MAG: fibronectin type III domain-containing protein [Acidobacteriota bacterium]
MARHLTRRLLLIVALVAAGASPLAAQTLPGAPGAPTVTTGLGMITVTWTAPTTGTAPTGYRLEFFSASPRALLAVFLTGPDRVFSAAVPNGSYLVSVGAINAAGTGPQSAETAFTVGPAAPSVPSAPIDLRAVVNGPSVTLTWNLPATSPVAQSFWVEVGTASDASNLGVYDTNSASTTVTSAMLPGLYFVRVRGRNAAGVGAASASVSFLVTAGTGCTQPPFAPIGLTRSVVGTQVSFAWNAPISGSAPTQYVVEVGSQSGQANLVQFATGTPSTVLTTTAVSGQYFVRVRGANACGVGPASNEVIVAIP